MSSTHAFKPHVELRFIVKPVQDVVRPINTAESQEAIIPACEGGLVVKEFSRVYSFSQVHHAVEVSTSTVSFMCGYTYIGTYFC